MQTESRYFTLPKSHTVQVAIQLGLAANLEQTRFARKQCGRVADELEHFGGRQKEAAVRWG